MVGSSYLDDALGEDSLHLYVKVFLIFLLLEFFFERLLPRFFDGALLMLGRVAMNFGILMEFLVLVSLAYIFRRKRESRFLKIVSSLIILVVVLALFMYYLGLGGFLSPPELSIMFEGVALSLICLTILRRMFVERTKGRLQRFSLLAFLGLLLLALSFFYYYEISVLFLSHYLVKLPLYFTLLDMAEILVPVSFVLVFLYAQSIPCKNFQLSRRTVLKIFALPTLLFAPLVAVLFVKPRVAQYMSWLLVEILGFTFSRSLVLVYMVGLWFYFAGISTLMEKGNVLGERFRKQEFMALLILFLAGFLSGFVYYYFMNVIGVLLLTSRLGSAQFMG